VTDPLPPNAAPWPEGREPTPFQRAVIDAVAALQPGELISYGDVADEIGRPGSGRRWPTGFVASVDREARLDEADSPCSSDGRPKFVECSLSGQSLERVDAEFVVAASHLHERGDRGSQPTRSDLV